MVWAGAGAQYYSGCIAMGKILGLTYSTEKKKITIDELAVGGLHGKVFI